MIHSSPPLVAARAHRPLRNAALVCGAVVVAGLFADPAGTWSGVLLGFSVLTGLAVAGPLFLSIHNLTNARWSAPLVPFAEGLTRTLPMAGLVGLALLCGAPSLYEWARPESVAADELLRHKAAWLNVPAFSIRLVAFFALWIWLGSKLVGRPDASRDQRIRRSAAFMAVFGVTFSLATVDWLQSLEPRWTSTIWALAQLAGVATWGIAVLMVCTVAARRSGAFPRPGSDALLDDLGKVALSLSLFWAYIAFCQYMLIWYTNNPEETTWYEARRTGGWYAVSVVNTALNWLVPFLVLMPRKCRRSETVIFRVAIVMLVGRLVDLFWTIGPAVSHGGPRLRPFDSAAVVGCLALFGLSFLRAMGRRPALPPSG